MAEFGLHLDSTAGELIANKRTVAIDIGLIKAALWFRLTLSPRDVTRVDFSDAEVPYISRKLIAEDVFYCFRHVPPNRVETLIDRIVVIPGETPGIETEAQRATRGIVRDEYQIDMAEREDTSQSNIIDLTPFRLSRLIATILECRGDRGQKRKSARLRLHKRERSIRYTKLEPAKKDRCAHL